MVSRSLPSTWMQDRDFPSRIFGDGFGSDYELYEEDDEFVLTIDMPGFEVEEIDLAWDDGILNVSAAHVDDERGREKTYHRRFRFPKVIDEEEIEASYTNGVLEVHLPTAGTTVQGTPIDVQG